MADNKLTADVYWNGDLYFWGDEMRESQMQRADEPVQITPSVIQYSLPSVSFEREYHEALVEVAKLEAENARLRTENADLKGLYVSSQERVAIEESANEERPARTSQDIVRDHVDHVVEHLKVGRTTKDQEAELTRALGDRKVGRALGR